MATAVVAVGCPGWDYRLTPTADTELPRRHEAVLLDLDHGRYDARIHATDTRVTHRRFFAGLTPPECDYYAGNYRGSHFHCLRAFAVGVDADRAVGAAPDEVAGRMQELAQLLSVAIDALDEASNPDLRRLAPEETLLQCVAVAARAFHEFLTIHPYADGNGHMSRFLVWALLKRYGHRPNRWTIEPRPVAHGYSQAISQARRGSPQALEAMILSAL